MDRLTAAVSVGVVLLCIAALSSVLIARNSQSQPDLSTPEGVVTAYIRAIQNKDPSQAWALLSPDASWNGGPRQLDPSTNSEAQFRQQVLSSTEQQVARIRVAGVRQLSGSTFVDIESTRIRSDPLFGGGPGQSATFELEPRDGQWRIKSAPYIWLLR